MTMPMGAQAGLPQRGETAYLAGETPDTNDLRCLNKEGTLAWFDDVNPHTGTRRSANLVLCRLVRNNGVTVYAKECFHYTAGSSRTATDRRSRLTWEGQVGLVDEYLLSTGCPVHDVFWSPVRGPATGLSSTLGAGGTQNNISQGDLLVAITATGTTSPDAGKIYSGSALTDNLRNVVGESMSALTTANTAADVLLYVGGW